MILLYENCQQYLADRWDKFQYNFDLYLETKLRFNSDFPINTECDNAIQTVHIWAGSE